jgi:subtilisin-like proprotein convertase family protein
MKNLLATAAVALATVVALPAAAAVTTVSNTAPIPVVDGGEITSSIVVSGVAGSITDLTVTLNSLSHTYPDDLVIGLLNEDAGLGFVFMSGAGGSTDIVNATLTFSDAAAVGLPESFVGSQVITSGTYLPSNYGLYEFTFFDNATSFADFDGLDPNGTWTLYVDDIFPADGGTIAGGFSLTITTDAGATPAVPEPASWAMMIAGFGLTGAALRRRQTKVSFA